MQTPQLFTQDRWWIVVITALVVVHVILIFCAPTLVNPPTSLLTSQIQPSTFFAPRFHAPHQSTTSCRRRSGSAISFHSLNHTQVVVFSVVVPPTMQFDLQALVWDHGDQHAQFVIRVVCGESVVSINQTANHGTWVTLGRFGRISHMEVRVVASQKAATSVEALRLVVGNDAAAKPQVLLAIDPANVYVIGSWVMMKMDEQHQYLVSSVPKSPLVASERSPFDLVVLENVCLFPNQTVVLFNTTIPPAPSPIPFELRVAARENRRWNVTRDPCNTTICVDDLYTRDFEDHPLVLDDFFTHIQVSSSEPPPLVHPTTVLVASQVHQSINHIAHSAVFLLKLPLIPLTSVDALLLHDGFGNEVTQLQAEGWSSQMLHLAFSPNRRPPRLLSISRPNSPNCFARAMFLRPLEEWGPTSAIESLRRKAVAMCGLAEPNRNTTAPRIVFLQRPTSVHTREPTNLEELVFEATRLLDGLPVDIVPVPVDFCGQVSLFQSADILITPHGAALTNLIFMRSYTVVIELVPFLFGFPLFKDLAKHSRVNYLEMPNLSRRRLVKEAQFKFAQVTTIAQCRNKSYWTPPQGCIPFHRDALQSYSPTLFREFLSFALRSVLGSAHWQNEKCMQLHPDWRTFHSAMPQFCGPPTFFFDHVTPVAG